MLTQGPDLLPMFMRPSSLTGVPSCKTLRKRGSFCTPSR